MNDNNEFYAPGWPGITPRLTSSSKTGVGTALTLHSRVWFTLSHGILNEIYFPRVDQACTRDQEFLVTDGKEFFSEEKRDCIHESSCEEHGIPLYRLTNTCVHQRYRIEKEILTDGARAVVLQKVRFQPLAGTLADYRLYSFSVRIWRISDTATRRGAGITKVALCSSRSVADSTWRSGARRRGARCPSDLWAFRTAGRIFRSITKCAGLTPEPRMERRSDRRDRSRRLQRRVRAGDRIRI
jgi:hypothetical protein